MASGHSLGGLIKWVRRPEWRDAFDRSLDRHLGRAIAKAGVSRGELAAVIGDDSFMTLWGCVFEDFLTQDLDDGRNVVDDYLKRRGWNESGSNKAYMAALRSSVMSLYEVSDIVPEESFLAHDLVRGGEPVRVSERAATRSLKPWDRIAARLVRVGTSVEMSGGVLPFDRDTSEVILKSLRRTGEKARRETAKLARELGTGVTESKIDEMLSEAKILRASAFLFTTIWLDDLLRQTRDPSIPQVRNSEGDELVFTTVHFPLKPEANIEAVRHVLEGIPTLRAESETFWNWIGSPTRASKKRPIEGRTFITTLDDGSLVLGTVEIKDKTLTLSVNSEPRAEQGRALLDPLLKGLVGEPLIERQTIEQMRASSPRGGPKSQSGLPPSEERAAIHKLLTDHYGRMLEEPIPALHDMTPREAVKTARGRENVIAWLKTLENHSARLTASDPIATYDFSWLWQELGIADERR
ncbi:MAG: hypothetical protein ACREV7_21470 [Steroidobacteraceae bacterium]